MGLSQVLGKAEKATEGPGSEEVGALKSSVSAWAIRQ